MEDMKDMGNMEDTEDIEDKEDMEITEDKKEIIFIIVMLHNIEHSYDTIEIVISISFNYN